MHVWQSHKSDINHMQSYAILFVVVLHLKNPHERLYQMINESKLIQQINVRITPEVHERLSSIAKERDLKIADIVREAIRNFFETCYEDQE